MSSKYFTLVAPALGSFILFFALPALAGNWGENWGEMTWGEVIAAVPLIGKVGFLALVLGLLGVALWTFRGRVAAGALLLAFMVGGANLAEAQVSVPNTFTDGTPALASEVNENFQTLAAAVNSSDCAAPDDVVCAPALSCPDCGSSDFFNLGVASVDITTDNAAAYADGAASVDITTDNAAVAAAAAAAVDITTDNAAAYASGVASVDITSDNQAVYDSGSFSALFGKVHEDYDFHSLCLTLNVPAPYVPAILNGNPTTGAFDHLAGQSIVFGVLLDNVVFEFQPVCEEPFCEGWEDPSALQLTITGETTVTIEGDSSGFLQNNVAPTFSGLAATIEAQHGQFSYSVLGSGAEFWGLEMSNIGSVNLPSEAAVSSGDRSSTRLRRFAPGMTDIAYDEGGVGTTWMLRTNALSCP
ncbi:hypothetical protein MK280_01150 [Myxococcota bacterium]|nr:hypothetical protein [Myxococcota bacterium]